MKEYRITIKDNGSIEEMEKHFNDAVNFVCDNRLNCKTECNNGFVTGHFSIVAKDFGSMGAVLQHFEKEIIEIQELHQF